MRMGLHHKLYYHLLNGRYTDLQILICAGSVLSGDSVHFAQLYLLNLVGMLQVLKLLNRLNVHYCYKLSYGIEPKFVVFAELMFFAINTIQILVIVIIYDKLLQELRIDHLTFSEFLGIQMLVSGCVYIFLQIVAMWIGFNGVMLYWKVRRFKTRQVGYHIHFMLNHFLFHITILRMLRYNSRASNLQLEKLNIKPTE